MDDYGRVLDGAGRWRLLARRSAPGAPPGMMPVLSFVVELVVSLFATAWVVRRDMRSLPPERYARSWNAASFWSAVVAFGPLCIPIHFVRTRRSALGAVLGVLWTLAVIAATSAASWLLSLAE